MFKLKEDRQGNRKGCIITTKILSRVATEGSPYKDILFNCELSKFNKRVGLCPHPPLLIKTKRKLYIDFAIALTTYPL
jgi:hypothetical protein